MLEKRTQKVQTALMSIEQVCQEAGISRAFLHKLCVDGKGPVRTKLTPKKVVVKRKHFNDWIEKLGEEE